MHLCIMVASLRMSLSLIGSQFNDRSPSELWSYFLSPKIIRPAKFWTFCHLAILLLLVLLQTVEQYSSLLKTKEFITNKSVFLSSRCLILMLDYHPQPQVPPGRSFYQVAQDFQGNSTDRFGGITVSEVLKLTWLHCKVSCDPTSRCQIKLVRCIHFLEGGGGGSGVFTVFCLKWGINFITFYGRVFLDSDGNRTHLNLWKRSHVFLRKITAETGLFGLFMFLFRASLML